MHLISWYQKILNGLCSGDTIEWYQNYGYNTRLVWFCYSKKNLKLCVDFGKKLFFLAMGIWGQGPKFNFFYVIVVV
jgi:hypothetical protein